MDEAGGIVTRRRVFLVPGYDPFPPRRYRELYRTEAARQASISGHEIAVAGCGSGAWRVRATIEGAVAETRIEVLAWNDIVRGRIRRPIPAIYAAMLVTLVRFAASGALVAMFRLRAAPLIAGLAPVGFMLLYLLAAGLAGWAALRGAGAAGAPGWAGWIAAAAAFAGAMAATRRLEPWLFTYYLVSDFAHVAGAMGAWPAPLEARMAAFRDRIREALEEGPDELLLIGHSSGAQIAVALAAGILRDDPGARLSLLTLGQAIPMTSFLPRAGGLRRDLRDLAACDRIAWVDVSAPADGACFALSDPVAVSGVAPEGQLWPLVLSAAFSETLDPARRRALRWRYFRRHIQYFCAFDRPGRYDYFAITAGPRSLAARFAGRAPSPSTIRAPLSPHRGAA